MIANDLKYEIYLYYSLGAQQEMISKNFMVFKCEKTKFLIPKIVFPMIRDGVCLFDQFLIIYFMTEKDAKRYEMQLYHMCIYIYAYI